MCFNKVLMALWDALWLIAKKILSIATNSRARKTMFLFISTIILLQYFYEITECLLGSVLIQIFKLFITQFSITLPHSAEYFKRFQIKPKTWVESRSCFVTFQRFKKIKKLRRWTVKVSELLKNAKKTIPTKISVIPKVF